LYLTDNTYVKQLSVGVEGLRNTARKRLMG
jgi:hypothetical protein